MNGSGQGRVAPSVAAVAGEPEAPQVAPSVVVVIVTRNPGAWFEDALRGLAAQNYPELSVLVVDAGSDVDPTPTVASVLPDAYVRHLDANPGFAAAANEALTAVEGAAFYAICHDDVALAPDAIRVMVEEAFRSNAGIVGPKIVMWDRTDRLLQVGMAADKTGFPSPLVDRGELDQEQHDAVRDVFCVPGGCMLVRSDLFQTLRGFDPEIPLLGEHLNLCWRAHVLGARVVVAPSAVARHIEALGERRDVDDRRRLQARHRLRSLLTCYGPWHLIRVLPQAAVLAVVETIYALLAGRFSHARDVAGAWAWNARRLGQIRANRRELQRHRRVPDHEIRWLQVRGSARFSAYLRGQIGRGDNRIRAMSTASREFAGALRGGSRRMVTISTVLASVVLLAGSRYLLTRDLASLGDLPAFPSRPWDLFGQWFSGWRDSGLGSESPAPTGFPLLGLAGTVLLGAMGVLRKLLVVGMLPIGAFGMWRLTRPIGTPRPRVLALIVFLAIPVPYNAIAEGRWGGLVVWAAAPWIAGHLLRVLAAEPWGVRDRHQPRRSGRASIALGLLLALVGAFAPSVLLAVAVLMVGLVIGSLLVGQSRGALRMFTTAIAAVVVAVVLHGPWMPAFFGGSGWDLFGGIGPGRVEWTLGRLLRFETGPLGAAPLGWSFLVVAALPLLIGRGWRLAWAGRGWAIALTGWAAAWASQQSWSPDGISTPEVFLAPAALGLALAAGLGVASFDTDLPGYRFGWRQVASFAAAVATLLGMLPVLGAATDGRWNRPATGFDRLLTFLDREQDDVGDFRVLWVGQPGSLPLTGWKFDDGLAYALSGGTPTVQDRWPGPETASTRLVADALHVVEDGETNRLGRLLGPMAVRYVVVPESAAPFDATARPVRESLRAALAEQLDLERVEVNARLTVYRNAAWVPQRALLPADSAVDEVDGIDDYLAAAAATDLSDAPPLLTTHDGAARFRGSVSDDIRVYSAEAASDHWQLQVDGHTARRHKAFGWANVFDVGEGGRAVLAYRTPILRYGLLLLQALLWLWAIAWLRRTRRPPVRAEDGATGGFDGGHGHDGRDAFSYEVNGTGRANGSLPAPTPSGLATEVTAP